MLFIFNLKYWILSFFMALCANMMAGPCSWLSADLHSSTDSCVFVGRSMFFRPKQICTNVKWKQLKKKNMLGWLKEYRNVNL